MVVMRVEDAVTVLCTSVVDPPGTPTHSFENWIRKLMVVTRVEDVVTVLCTSVVDPPGTPKHSFEN